MLLIFVREILRGRKRMGIIFRQEKFFDTRNLLKKICSFLPMVIKYKNTTGPEWLLWDGTHLDHIVRCDTEKSWPIPVTTPRTSWSHLSIARVL